MGRNLAAPSGQPVVEEPLSLPEDPLLDPPEPEVEELVSAALVSEDVVSEELVPEDGSPPVEEDSVAAPEELASPESGTPYTAVKHPDSIVSDTAPNTWRLVGVARQNGHAPPDRIRRVHPVQRFKRMPHFSATDDPPVKVDRTQGASIRLLAPKT